MKKKQKFNCLKPVCGAPLRKYGYYVGKDGPFCASCAKFISHLKSDHKGIINAGAKIKKVVLEQASELGVDQITFIEAKVRELGSLDAVEVFYSKRDRVGEFARKYGKWVYRMGVASGGV